ncbi:MAG: maleylacetoacetate isomerase [Betaproteobacteria bacterium RIFCSPLOWO2_02_FULL_64_12]|nr:MAG: maleylacetoacetate isomerase [Betaproteobacteria bacterium RIFCSPLOWO2_02_FULL_64_12]
MKLYTYFRSSASFRVRIALNHKGLAYDSVVVNLPRAEHAEPKFRTVSVQGLVPVLEDGGKILSQSLAIIEYLDEIHPGPKLLPPGPLDRAYVRAFSQIIACEIHPLNNLRTLKYIRRTYNLDEEGVNSWYRHWIADGFAMMEAFLLENGNSGKHCFRDQVTMADCCLVPQVFNAQRYQCDLKPFPTVMRIHEQCMNLPAFLEAQPSRQADAM